MADDEVGEKPSIPKFASFKRRPASAVHDNRPAERPSPQNHQSPARKSRDHRSIEPHPRPHLSKDREDLSASKKLAGVDANRNKQISQEFVVDKTGDPQILVYGSLDRYGVPKYSRSGAGNVIGSLDGQRINRLVGDDKGLILSRNEYGLSAKERSVRWKSAFGRENEVRITPYQDHALLQDIDLTADFIRLKVGTSRKRRRLNDNPESDSLVSELNGHSRLTVGEGDSKDASHDPDLLYGDTSEQSSDADDHQQSAPKDLVPQTRAELHRKVETNPNNMDAWLNLIRHQDTNLGVNEFLKEMTSAEKRSNADVKLSIYKKALAQIREPEARETLLQGMMNEGSKIWDSTKTLSQWNNLLHENPEYLGLWTKYLDFKQATFSTFRYDDVRIGYLECLSRLSQARIDRSGKAVDQVKIFEAQVYVMLRMTLFMRESGFSEFAVAAWQAVLEYQFFMPLQFQETAFESHVPNNPDVVSAFESFWDSEVARLGEEGAEGWQKSSVQSRQSPKVQVVAEKVVHGEAYTSWAASERQQDLTSRMPARTTDDLEENDPYRVVLFSDIRSFLVKSPSKIWGRRLVLDAFLIFCQLPPCYGSDTKGLTKTWWQDGFMQNRMLHQSSANAKYGNDNQTGHQHRNDNPFELSTPDHLLEADTLFSNPHSWSSVFDGCYGHDIDKEGTLDKAWILRAVKTLALADDVGDSDFAVYSLGLELHLAPHTVRKSAKAMLKKRPSSLSLYNACALIEYRLSNPEKGQSILLHSINLARQLKDPDSQDVVLLWHTLIWELLYTQGVEAAFWRLTTFAEEEVQPGMPNKDSQNSPLYSPALLLRTESALTTTRDHMLSMELQKHAAIAAELLILLSYFRDPSSLATATSAFKTNLTILAKSPAPSQEYLHQFFARLIYYHATHALLVKPAEVRTLLSDSIAAFPQNTIFLSLYAWNEARFRIEDRVRSVLKEIVLDKNSSSKRTVSVISHFFAIHNEMSRALTSAGNANAIRSAFERAVKSECGEHCAALWKMYLSYESSQGQIGKAKNVFYRGIRACPWAKELYMAAFDYLRGEKGMTDADLRGINELMIEKELRIHVDLIDLLEQNNEKTS